MEDDMAGQRTQHEILYVLGAMIGDHTVIVRTRTPMGMVQLSASLPQASVLGSSGDGRVIGLSSALSQTFPPASSIFEESMINRSLLVLMCDTAIFLILVSSRRHDFPLRCHLKLLSEDSHPLYVV